MIPPTVMKAVSISTRNSLPQRRLDDSMDHSDIVADFRDASNPFSVKTCSQ